MLSLKPLCTVNRVTLFGDNADPNQFYYLPEDIHLTLRDDGTQDFTLLKYLGDVANDPSLQGQQLGGGFLTFSVDLSLDGLTKSQLLGKASQYAASQANLVCAPFEDGTVRLVGLDMSSTPVAGQIRFVETEYGTSRPSLFGDLQATFSLQLTQEGATLIDQAFTQGGQPFGVIYDLTFLGLRPAFDVTVFADYKRISDSFSAQVAAQYMMVKAEIDAGFKKLEQDQAIKVTVNSYTTDAQAQQAMNSALAFLENDLLAKFFTPSLPVPAAQAAPIVNSVAPALGLPQAGGRPLTQVNSGAQAQPGASTRTSNPVNAPSVQPTLSNHPTTSQAGLGALNTVGSNPAQGLNVPGLSQAASALGLGAPAGGAAHPPAAGAGAAHPPAASAAPIASRIPAAGAAPAGGGSGSSFSIGFKLSYMHTEDTGTFTANWNESMASEEHHSPNGTFGALLQGVDRSKHIFEINLNDPFFQTLNVSVDCPTPFAGIGLSEVKVHVEYGTDATNPTQPYFITDIDLKPDATGKITPLNFTTALDANHALSYKYTVDLYFDPTTSIRGQQMHYTSAPATTMARSLIIDPMSYVGMLRVNSVAGDLDFTYIPKVQVQIGYDDVTNAFHVADSFILTSDSPTFNWMVRLTDPTQNSYWYQLTYFLADGQVITMPKQTSIERSLAINDPWEDQFVLLVDAALVPSVSHVIVDIEYADSAGQYKFSYVKRIATPADVPSNVSIPLLDRTNRTYTYTVSSVKVDNTVQNAAPVKTSQGYVIVQAPT